MLEAASSAFGNLFGCPCTLEIFPTRLLFLFLGVVMGLALGVIPGLGGLTGLAILLPFTFDMDAYAAIATIIGLLAVAPTADTIPSALFSVPGTVGSQATIMDGHPMAKKGEAGRAFGAAYTASLIGGVFGALILALSIPVLRPIVLAFASPEFFMMGIMGITMVAVLSGGAPVKGLIAGALGLSVGMVGMDPQAGILRWGFNQLYLWDGLHLVAVTLGIFAIPEIVDLAIKGTRIADVPQQAIKGVATGIRDVFRHWFLVLRCSALGVWVGFVPGLGASVVDWFAYGHAAQTEKDAHKTFGTGDVRGLIAPESANNAKEGGGLIPTIGFGVPGSASMALLLGALLIHGITPGPDMLTTHLDITYTMIWSLAIANILGAGICLAFVSQLAKVATLRIQLLTPLVIAVVFLASYQVTAQAGNLLTLMGFSLLGWFMKRFGWPRPPLILGLVLSAIIENYLFIALQAHGAAWLARPLVWVIAALTIISLVYGLHRSERRVRRPEAKPALPKKFRISAGSVFTLLIFLIFLAAVIIASDWPFRTRMFPWTIGFAALGLCVIQLFLDLWRAQDPTSTQDATGVMDLPVDRDVPVAVVARRALAQFGWVFGLFGGVWLVGFLIATPLYVASYLIFQAREKWRTSLLCTALIAILLFGLFHYILNVRWLEPTFAAPQHALIEALERITRNF
jgi:TctA family transporter